MPELVPMILVSDALPRALNNRLRVSLCTSYVFRKIHKYSTFQVLKLIVECEFRSNENTRRCVRFRLWSHIFTDLQLKEYAKWQTRLALLCNVRRSKVKDDIAMTRLTFPHTHLCAAAIAHEGCVRKKNHERRRPRRISAKFGRLAWILCV